MTTARLLRALRLALFVVLAIGGLELAWTPSTVRAQDGETETETTDRRSDLQRKKDLLRRMDRELKEKLKKALHRFADMSPAEREKLRKRAAAVGNDRLRELHRVRHDEGQDVQKLRRRHDAMRKERGEIVRLLGGEARFASLTAGERRYVERVAVKRYHSFMKRTLLGLANNLSTKKFENLTRRERRDRVRAMVRAAEDRLVSELSPEARTAYDAQNEYGRRRQRQELFAEYRLRHAGDFAAGFDLEFLQPFLQKPAEERAKMVKKLNERVRWFEVKRVLKDELGVSSDAIMQLLSMRSDEAARVRDAYEDARAKGLSRQEQRVRVEDTIRRLYGQGAADRLRTRTPRKGSKRRKDRDERRDGDAENESEDQ